jgi:hypothetical protein
MGTVHGVAGLEGDDAGPAAVRELRAQCGGREPERREIVVTGPRQTVDDAAEVVLAGAVEEMGHTGMGPARRAVDALRFLLAVGPEHVAYVEEREGHAFRVAQGHRAPRPQRAHERLRHVQHDRNRPEGTAGQAHGTTDGLVIRASEEAAQRREPSVEERSRSHSCRGVRSQEGDSRANASISARRSHPHHEVHEGGGGGPDEVVGHRPG